MARKHHILARLVRDFGARRASQTVSTRILQTRKPKLKVLSRIVTHALGETTPHGGAFVWKRLSGSGSGSASCKRSRRRRQL
jgi:hypothetical protein